MAMPSMILVSPVFERDQTIPARHTCEGQDLSPRLRWEHPPEETRSFALIMRDADAPAPGTASEPPHERHGGDAENAGPRFTHWVLYDIPADTEELDEGSSGIGRAGRNDFQATGYKGPCPPARHDHHRYHFTLYALDVDSLDLDSGATAEQVEGAMEGHILSRAQLPGLFRRQTGA